MQFAIWYYGLENYGLFLACCLQSNLARICQSPHVRECTLLLRVLAYTVLPPQWIVKTWQGIMTWTYQYC